MEITQVIQLLLQNELKAKKTINMVPSENFCSVLSRVPLLLDVYNRYFFNANNDPMHWNFRGAQDAYQIETEVAIPLLKKLAGTSYVNLRPISGLNCMMLVMSAMGGGIGGSVLLVSPDQGGHYASKQLAESLGLHADFIQGIDEHTIDYIAFREQLQMKAYNLIYIDQSNCLFPLDVQQLCDIVKDVSPSTKVHVDASHWLGLIFGEAMVNPIKAGADSYGGTTHKTFPGPQRAVFCTNEKELHKMAADTQYFMISSHHFGSVASLAIALLEFDENGGRNYAKQTIENTKKLAEMLFNLGYDVKGQKYGFTAGHQIWMSTNNCGIDSYEASERLYKAGIRVNAFSELPGSKESILRIGVNEITRFGAKSDDMEELAILMNSAIMQNLNSDIIMQRVENLRSKYASPYQFDLSHNEELSFQLQELLSCVFESKYPVIHC